jgi:putative membrane protein
MIEIIIENRMTSQPEKKENVLVLCVDRDGDIGAKANLKTPIFGREENLNAAVAFALKDPEEPDANAMFEAIRVFDRLKTEGKPYEDFQIATISGSEFGDVSADRKLVSELNEVLTNFRASEVVLVTDGYQDELVLPFIESRVPVSSVRRVVIKHSKSIEETAAVFSRYFKMIVEDPRYSRLLLGIPGILLIVLVVLSFYNLLALTWLVFLVILGGALLIKGFGVDKAVRSAVKWARDYEPPPVPVQITSFATAAGLLSVAIGVYLGISEVSKGLITFPTLGEMPSLLGEFIQYAAVLIFIGICVVLSGRAIKWYFEHDARLLRTVVIIAVAAWSSQIALQVSQILINPSSEYAGLVVSILVGILVGLSSLLAAFLVHRRYASFFKKEGVEVEEFSQET